MAKRPPKCEPALDGCEVLVGVAGGIAAYKVCHVVSRLVQQGAGVTVAMTESATRFVGPLTFQTLTARRVVTSLWASEREYDAQHIRLSEAADLFLVAPATANVIGKIACGIADDLVTTLAMSAACPLLLAPSMNTRMYENPVVQRNIQSVEALGHEMIAPGEGWLACRTVGAGRMAEPDEILSAVTAKLRTRPAKPSSASPRPGPATSPDGD